MIYAPIGKCCIYHRGADEYMRNLRNKWQDLECRKSDTEARMKHNYFQERHQSKKLKVGSKMLERMNAEIQAIEREAGEGKCFSRAHVGKLAFKKIGEMEELYQRGVFIDSLVVDPPVSHGEILSTPILIGESTAERVKEKIWACLLDDDDVRKIGVYGMGDLKEVEHERERAAKLKAKLEDKKKYVLILDDMWEAFPLEKLGIPEPISSNRCKLVLTTRLLDVCLGMSYLKVIVEEVLERCAQLPLAIVTIAASFKCLIHDFEWRDALEDLKTSVKGSNNIEAEVFKILEFSYERLKVGELQQCLLHCALYPEDFMIKKRELIEHLIDEGIIERRNSRKAEFDRGYSMLNKLENACLLEGGIDEDDEEKFVKMHDLVRDMVLRVASPQFKVEGHLGLEDFSDEGKWGEDLVRASLMYNNISRIPPNASPMCPKLSTLLLQGNRSLKDVPDSLFEHLHGLNVLDLSNTSIEYLPNSVSNLENLTTLRLGGCVFLKRVPSLAKLTKLRKLDLERTEIMEVPDGLEMLVNLRYLDLNVEKLKIMPPEILPKLSHLQYLVVHGLFTLVTMKGEEVASLKNLKTFGGLFSDMYEFSTYMRSLEKGRLASYKIQVGKPLYI
uniref:Uncharacterized protein n=1 Tax=Fagus sylvatica TaxID=28930 RepID=A0A2N9FYN4_FAGSY